MKSLANSKASTAQRMLEAEEALFHMASHNHSLQRTVWMLVDRLGGSAAVDETKIPLLWRLGFQKAVDGGVAIRASALPDPDRRAT